MHQSQQYRAKPRTIQVEQESVEEMLSSEVIILLELVRASPVVLVPKSDGSLRVCVRYCKPNAINFSDIYAMPRMYEPLDYLENATVITTSHCNFRNW